ncbi:MAG: flagellar filament capping protein FliD, partial [Candidatus Krumholzibacteria bacterium]|nr:flagellar filament capping protein FliD [Candidatus Krumholzibacteria bacterium]
IRSSLGRAVEGIAGELDHLSEIGIGTAVNGNFNSDGTLALDESMLRDALSEDLDGVVSLLASTGEASDANITFLSAGAGTVGSAASAGYEVRITEAASRGTFTGLTFMEPTPGTPLILDSENSSFKISVDGVESKLISLPEGEYSSAAEVAEAIESAINSDSQLGSRDVEVRWVDDGGGLGHLELESQSWGSSSSLQFEEVSSGLTALLGLEEGTAQDGQDVAGYFLVNGVLEEAQGQGRMLKGVEESGKTLDLGVLVELTALELSEQGEDQGRVQVFTGVTDSLSRLLDSYLDPAYGLLERRQEDFRQGIETFEEQVERIDSRLKIRRERYLREFQRMETLLSELNSQSAMMMSMLGGISGAGGQG